MESCSTPTVNREAKEQCRTTSTSSSSDEKTPGQRLDKNITQSQQQPVLFDARQYLDYYFPRQLDSEDIFALEFLHKVYSTPEVAQCAAAGCMVEVGGGPVIDKLISASGWTKCIFHLDPSASAQREIKLWKEASPRSYNWSSQFDYVATLEKQDQQLTETDNSVLSSRIEARLRNSIFCIGAVNLLSKTPNAKHGGILSPEIRAMLSHHKTTVVSSHCCVECITSSISDYERALNALVSFCEIGCFLVMTINVDTDEWFSCNIGSSIPAYRISVDEVLDELKKRGFSILLSEIHEGTEQTEMERTLALLCRRTELTNPI